MGHVNRSMNKLPTETRVQILGMMVEGMSIRAIARLTGASKNTIVRFLRDAGEACARYQDETLRGLACERIQVDEIWSFVTARHRRGLRCRGRAVYSARPASREAWTRASETTKWARTWRS
jgi:hypothetical protein